MFEMISSPQRTEDFQADKYMLVQEIYRSGLTHLNQNLEKFEHLITGATLNLSADSLSINNGTWNLPEYDINNYSNIKYTNERELQKITIAAPDRLPAISAAILAKDLDSLKSLCTTTNMDLYSSLTIKINTWKLIEVTTYEGSVKVESHTKIEASSYNKYKISLIVFALLTNNIEAAKLLIAMNAVTDLNAITFSCHGVSHDLFDITCILNSPLFSSYIKPNPQQTIKALYKAYSYSAAINYQDIFNTDCPLNADEIFELIKSDGIYVRNFHAADYYPEHSPDGAFFVPGDSVLSGPRDYASFTPRLFDWLTRHIDKDRLLTRVKNEYDKPHFYDNLLKTVNYRTAIHDVEPFDYASFKKRTTFNFLYAMGSKFPNSADFFLKQAEKVEVDNIITENSSSTAYEQMIKCSIM